MGGFCNEVRCIMKKENNFANNQNSGSISGRIGYVLAVAGSAVALGNICSEIWRRNFPADLYSSDSVIWLCTDHVRNSPWTNDQKESGRCI